MTMKELKKKLNALSEEELEQPLLLLDELNMKLGFAFAFSSFHSFLYNEKTPNTFGGMANYDTDIVGKMISFQSFHDSSYTLHPDIKRGWCFYSKHPRVTADDKFNKKFNKNRIPLTEVLKDYTKEYWKIKEKEAEEYNKNSK